MIAAETMVIKHFFHLLTPGHTPLGFNYRDYKNMGGKNKTKQNMGGSTGTVGYLTVDGSMIDDCAMCGHDLRD